MENVCARIITGCVSFRTRTPDVLFLADLPSIRNRIKLRNATIFETVKRLGHEAAAYKTTNVDPPPPSRRGKAPDAPASWRTVALESVEAAGLSNNRLPLYFDKELSPGRPSPTTQPSLLFFKYSGRPSFADRDCYYSLH